GANEIGGIGVSARGRPERLSAQQFQSHHAEQRRCGRHLPRESARLYAGKGNFDEKFGHIRLGQARRPVVKRLCGCLGAVNCCLAIVRANSMIEKPSGKILSRKRKTIYQKNHIVAGTVPLLTMSATTPGNSSQSMT